MSMIATYREAPRRIGGRPYIGPKAQGAVPVEIFQAVEEEAKERGCPMADIWRELIIEGWDARQHGGA